MNTETTTAFQVIRYPNGSIRVIRYSLVSVPIRFERRGRRFKRAWEAK